MNHLVTLPLSGYITRNAVFSVLMLAAGLAQANNIQVSNAALVGQNTANQTYQVQFDISWENSWRTSVGPSNWDAAWIFVKYRNQTDYLWHHATLNYTNGTGGGDGHQVPANAVIASADDTGGGGAHGVFLHRSADLIQSNVSYSGVQLRWNYGVDGVSDDEQLEICVLAIEMVLVPEGAFSIGSGGNETRAFYTYNNVFMPYQISSESAIPVGTAAGNLYYRAGGGDQMGPIPTTFPKGFAAFYCMKYEISQGQYAEFLNKLTQGQVGSRFNASHNNGFNRYGIFGALPLYSSTSPYVACNFLNWADLAAYLDWAALRPMTELEYEKAGRGTLAPVPGEYAWGTNQVAAVDYTLSAQDAANEGIATNYSQAPFGNAAHSSTVLVTVGGPVRVGIFAANAANTGRVTAGAGYYGCMELSGNLTEHTVSVGSPEGRAFTGLHGDGVLDAGGGHDVSLWPAGALAPGAGIRGGYWAVTLSPLSDRTFANNPQTIRSSVLGGRGVRSAP